MNDKKTLSFARPLALVGMLGVLLLYANVAGAEQLSKPKLVLPKPALYSVTKRPSITLSTAETDCAIYYRISPERNMGAFGRYFVPVTINGDYKFVLEAFAKKDGYADSEVLTVQFNDVDIQDIFDFHRLKCRSPKVGDKFVLGTFAETKLFMQMTKRVCVSIARVDDMDKFEEEYYTVIKNGKFEVKLKKPLKKGDGVSVYAQPRERYITLKQMNNNSIQELWHYYSFESPLHKTEVKRTSNNDNLKSLKLSTGKLDHKFGKYRLKYQATINANKKSVTITAKKQSPKAKLKIKVGSKGKYKLCSSAKVKLKKGQSKKIYIHVKAQDGVSKRTYVVTVTRKR